MNQKERDILAEKAGDTTPRITIRSETRIDTGRWWRRSRLWLCVMDQDVLVLAASRRQYIERIAIADCQGSYYCHSSGELVLNSEGELAFNHLAMSPVEAVSVLDAIEPINQMNETQKKELLENSHA